MNKNSRPWWSQPWSYKESFAAVGGVLFAGLMLQLTIGNFNYEIIRFPVNMYLLIATLALVAALSIRPKSVFFNGFRAFH